MTGLCDQEVCDTTQPPAEPPTTPAAVGCGLPANGVWTNATIRTNAIGCISAIESGDPLTYTPDPCCPDAGTGPGGGGLDGPPGPPGVNATVGIGTVNTVAYGTPASVTNSGTATAAILNFYIPAGEPGDDAPPTSGVTYTAAGYSIQNGLVQSLPTQWPPVVGFTPATLTSGGIGIGFSKDANGLVTVSLDTAGLNATTSSLSTAASTATAGQASLSTAIDNLATLLGGQITSLSTALSTAVSRIDAAGIP